MSKRQMMNRQNKRLGSLVKAVALAYIFMGIFYWDLSANLGYSFSAYLNFSYEIVPSLYIVAGVLIILKKRFLFFLSIGLFLSWFGGIFAYSEQTIFSYQRLICEILANIFLLVALFKVQSINKPR